MSNGIINKEFLSAKIFGTQRKMQASQLHYYCYGCQSHFASQASTFSCLSCDSNAIENCKSEPSSRSLAQFKPFLLKSTESDEPLGMLENTVDPIEEQSLEVFTILRPITHRVLIIDLDDQLQTLRPELEILRALRALLGDAQEGVTEEEISKLEKVDQVAECSICQESHGENTNDTQDSDDKDEGGYKLRCHHIFHEGCIRPWFEKARTCPLCRKSITEEE